MSLRSSKSRILITGLLAALLLAITALSTRAANPPPVQVYFLSLPSAQTLDILQDANPGGTASASPVTSNSSIAVSASGTLIYYDQWENGYVVDLANPTVAETYASPGNLGGVQIWGDGILTNGVAPGYPTDLLSAGNVIILTNDVTIPRNSSEIRFDGGDRFGATNSVAVVRNEWAGPSGIRTLYSFAHENYPTNRWGQAYTAPVGCNTSNAGSMFEYAALAIMAEQDGTVVEIDADANGSYETTTTLDKGESFLETGNGGSPCAYVRQGAKVRSTDSNKPLQVQLFLADIDGDYELRDITLVPDGNLSSEYYNPVGYTGTTQGGFDAGNARVWLYNPNNTTIYVRCELGAGAGNQDRTIAAKAVAFVDVPNLAAANCYATNSSFTTKDPNVDFTGLVTMDVEGTGSPDQSTGFIWDWSATLLPVEKLSNLTIIGLGLGRDPTNTTTALNENGNPIWATPVCDTVFYVDWDNDGTPDLVDLNGDGDATDTVDGVSESTSNNGMSVTRLKSVRFYQPGAGPRDQSGAKIYTRVSTGNTGAGGCAFAAAWGQDPRIASGAAPGLDVGTTVLPVQPVEVGKDYNLVVDADGNGAPSPGDTIRYTITIENISLNTINNVKIFDEIPDFTTYVANSTDKDTSGDGTGPWTPIPDNSGFPLDEAGGVILGNLDANKFFLVQFDVTLDAITSPANDYDAVTNCAVVTMGSDELEACADTVIDNMGQIGDTIWEDTNGDGDQDPGEPGIPGIIVELDPPAGVDLGNGPGNPITVTTDANGNYLFAGLPAGNYTVTVTNPPPGTTNTGDPNGGGDSTATVTLGANESNLNQDFGYQPIASVNLSGNVFNDTNGLTDGIVNGTGIGLPGGTQLYANLVDPNGNVVATDAVAANGTYDFSNVAPNTTYTVVLSTTQGTVGQPAPAASLPSGWINTGENLGAGAGSDGNPNGVLSVPVATTDVTNANFGIQQTGSIGDKIWRDDDGDGVQDPGEPGIPNVTVTLDPPAGVDLGNGPGNPVTDTTDANGNYLFSDLPPGSYTVTVTPPPGTTNTGDPDGVKDSTTTLTLAAGQNNLTQDFGYQANPVNLSGNVFNDANGLNDNTVNGVGIGSPDGVQLYANLVGPNGNVVATVPVNANGTYSFSNVAAHTTYTVVLSTTNGTVGNPPPAASLPAGWINTGENLGAGPGNDGNPNGVLSVPVAATDVTNANFGIQETGTIGDTIWQDIDGDGVQDPGEPGIPGITVTLDPPAGVDLGAGPGNPVTDVTDANGKYEFIDLPPGSYTVTVTPPPGTINTGDPDGVKDSTTTLPLAAGESNLNQDFGYQPTGQIGDKIWQDTDGDGVQDPGEPGIPNVTVTLDPPAGVDLGNGPGNPVTDVTDANGNYLFDNLPGGNYTVTVTPPPGTVNTGDPDGVKDSTTNLTLADGEQNLNQDFGFQPALQIGDKIWRDDDGDGVQDPGEPGIPGITVTLDPPAGVDLGAGPGNPVTDVTDANGNYLFENLPPGAYTVTVTPPPAMNNTGDPDGGNDSTAAVTLTTQSNLDQDFGYQPYPIFLAGNVFHDVNGLNDNTVNGLGLGQPNGVQLYANLVGPSGNVVATVPVNANGSYLFTGVTANATYQMVLSTTQGTVGNPPPAASLPAGWVNTGEHIGAGPGSDGTVDGKITVVVGTQNVTDINFGIRALNVCPVGFSTNNWTDILGIGMGSTKKHKNIAKVSIPNYQNVTDLYGQMVAKDVGRAKYVRFMYPNSTYVQVNSVTSPSSQFYGAMWWGADLNPAANIRGRWFLQKEGTKNHIPRALIMFPTYNDPSRQWINVFETFDAADTQVYWETAGGWTQTQEITLDITPPQATTTFNVEIAMVDNDTDTRPVEVTVSAGGVTAMQAPTGPNKGELLNIMTFTLTNVPAGTDTITITIHSPSPNEQLFYGGDSAAITGVTANYQCVVPTIP